MQNLAVSFQVLWSEIRAHTTNFTGPHSFGCTYGRSCILPSCRGSSEARPKRPPGPPATAKGAPGRRTKSQRCATPAEGRFFVRKRLRTRRNYRCAQLTPSLGKNRIYLQRKFSFTCRLVTLCLGNGRKPWVKSAAWVTDLGSPSSTRVVEIPPWGGRNVGAALNPHAMHD